MPASVPSHLRTALEPPRWALGFYRRHLVLIVGISLVPAAERFAGALWDTPQPAMELVTTAARVLLLVLVVRMAIVADPDIARACKAPLRGYVLRFYRRHWSSPIAQLLLLGAAWAVFDLFPEQVVTRWVPESGIDLYWGLLLAVKNPTIIAFTFVWIVGVFRQPLRWAALQRERELREAEGAAAGR